MSWHLISTKIIDNSNMSSDVFLKIMTQWLNEPQQLAKTILRGEIIYSIEKEMESSLKDRIDYLKESIVLRKLLPRLTKKDNWMIQKVVTKEIKEGIWQVEHSPIDEKIVQEDGNLDNQFIDLDITQEKLIELPSFCPKVNSYRIIYNNELKSVTMEYFNKFKEMELELSLKMLQNLFNLLIKYITNLLKGYQKRVYHDVIIDKIKYQDNYLKNKDKFLYWVKNWPENTDASKFVFEDIGIATFLNLLFERPSTFIDLGCGNGLLVHLLNQLGHQGQGIDLVKRKIWDLFKEDKLICRTLIPNKEQFIETWLIGNHCDELSPWIPIMANNSSYETKFIIIPCCFYNLNGTRYQHLKKKENIGNYENYINYLIEIIKLCGYIPEKEYLRIPSTKNVCLIGRNRSFKKDDIIESNRINNNIKELLKDVNFQPRINKNTTNNQRH
ncbi:DUF1613-domain-containing protein [Neoconidiobolus thromboides FSU 785]|nr:DUF1613-domain-containing protein [Neoconidiobolus thromboides FSU 785]